MQGQGYCLETAKITVQVQANKACTRLGVRAAFLSMFLASAESHFEGEFTLPPQAGNASRWAVDDQTLDKGIHHE
jgi:hypothetical protein